MQRNTGFTLPNPLGNNPLSMGCSDLMLVLFFMLLIDISPNENMVILAQY